jgi:hypothetical protein
VAGRTEGRKGRTKLLSSLRLTLIIVAMFSVSKRTSPAVAEPTAAALGQAHRCKRIDSAPRNSIRLRPEAGARATRGKGRGFGYE